MVIAIVLILRKQINSLIERINKIGFAGIAAEATQQKQKTDDIATREQQKKSGKDFDKTLGMFSDSTVEYIAKIVEGESQASEIKDATERAESLKKYSQLLYLILSFERLYSITFGSQLFILDRVNTTHNETQETLKRYYNEAEKIYPEFYSSYPYEEYFKFLTNNSLIVISENNICTISLYGRDFLKFLVEQGKPLNKLY